MASQKYRELELRSWAIQSASVCQKAAICAGLECIQWPHPEDLNSHQPARGHIHLPRTGGSSSLVLPSAGPSSEMLPSSSNPLSTYESLSHAFSWQACSMQIIQEPCATHSGFSGTSAMLHLSQMQACDERSISIVAPESRLPSRYAHPVGCDQETGREREKKRGHAIPAVPPTCIHSLCAGSCFLVSKATMPCMVKIRSAPVNDDHVRQEGQTRT